MNQARLQELKSRFSPELGPNQPDEWQAGHREEKKMYTTRYGRSHSDVEGQDLADVKWQAGHKDKKMYTTRYGRSDPALLEEERQDLADDAKWQFGQKEKKMYTTRYGRSDPGMVMVEDQEGPLLEDEKWEKMGQKEKKMYTTRYGRSDPSMVMVENQEEPLDDEKWGAMGQKEKKMYTTRYGRSDPSMRLQEFQTSYFPEPDPTPSEVEWKGQQYPTAWEYEIDSPEKQQGPATESAAASPPPCLFSRRWNVLICQVPWYSKRDTRILY